MFLTCCGSEPELFLAQRHEGAFLVRARACTVRGRTCYKSSPSLCGHRTRPDSGFWTSWCSPAALSRLSTRTSSVLLRTEPCRPGSWWRTCSGSVSPSTELSPPRAVPGTSCSITRPSVLPLRRRDRARSSRTGPVPALRTPGTWSSESGPSWPRPPEPVSSDPDCRTALCWAN